MGQNTYCLVDKKVVLIGFVMLFANVLFVSAGTSGAGVEYDDELNGQFLLNEWVHVSVDVRDTSGITFSKDDSDDGFKKKVDERKRILFEASNSVLSSLSEDEFRLEGMLDSGRGFYGDMTREGFDKLLQDDRVRKIYAEKEFWLSGAIWSSTNLLIFLGILFLLFIILICLLAKLRRNQLKSKRS